MSDEEIKKYESLRIDFIKNGNGIIRDIPEYFVKKLKNKLYIEGVSTNVRSVGAFEDQYVRTLGYVGWYCWLESENKKEYGYSINVSEQDFIDQGYSLSDVDLVRASIQKCLEKNFSVINLNN